MRQLAYIAFISLISLSAEAEEIEFSKSERDDLDFALGVGTAAVFFDSKMKFTDKESGRHVFIDPEGTLGLPELARVNTIYGAYRIAERHHIGFSYFGINRETSLFSLDLNFDDVILVQGNAKLKDETDFYQVTYAYSLFKDNRSSINSTFGIYGLDLKLAFEAEGELIVDGVSQSGTYRDSVSVFAPLPLIGLDFIFSFTPKWSMRTKIALVGGTYQDVTAKVFTSAINAHYLFTKNIGGVIGISYFDSRVEVDEAATLTEVNYGYSGMYAGLHFAF